MKRARKLKIGLISVLLTFGVGVFAWLIVHSSILQPTKLLIPEASWEKLFFEGIDQITELAKLEKLREKNLPRNGIEIRIWEGFGLEDLEGVIFSKADEKWRAYHVRSNSYREPTTANFIQLSGVPKSGWNTFIKEFFSLGISDLPDARSIGCEMYHLDGRRYVVEVYENKTYRTYMYSSNAGEKCAEGKMLQKIVELIAVEFENKLQRCRGNEWLSCGSRKPAK